MATKKKIAPIADTAAPKPARKKKTPAPAAEPVATDEPAAVAVVAAPAPAVVEGDQNVYRFEGDGLIGVFLATPAEIADVTGQSVRFGDADLVVSADMITLASVERDAVVAVARCDRSIADPVARFREQKGAK